MQWTSTSAAEVDTWVQDTFYQGLTHQGEGIDLRIEMHAILYGGLGRVPKGHWIIMRKYDRTQPSQYYDKETHEGVRGPAFQYSDSLLRTRQVPVSKRTEQILPTPPGMDISDSYIYYFEYTVNPKIGDDILELDLPNNRPVPTISSVTPIDRYTIERTHPYRLENGNIQYWMVLAKHNEVTY